MHLSAEIHYQSVSPPVVYGMITDPAFVERKCSAGSVAYEVDVVADSRTGSVVATQRTLPDAEVPEFVRRFVGGAVRVNERVEWDLPDAEGGREGRIRVEIAGVPVRLTGQVFLRPFGGGTVYEVEGELKASVPLLGGRIERAAEPAIRAGLRVEERIGREWLEEAAG